QTAGYNVAQSGWSIRYDYAASNLFAFQYRAPGSGTVAECHSCAGNGNMTIQGATAQKSTGTTWSNPSDRRLKDEIADYPTGLAAVVQLQPRTFVYNGKGGSTAGHCGVGVFSD